jgi:GT2 family glycosyltransferase
MHPRVSAIVLNYRTPQLAVKCVQALERQSMAGELEIIAIDNHSEDDSIGVLRNRLKTHPHVTILESRDNIGYGKGNAIGIARAAGEFLLIINPDNELEPEGIARMLRVMEEDPTIGIVAPKLVHEDGTIRESARSFPRMMDVVIKRTPLQRWFPHAMDRYLQRTTATTGMRDTDWIVGACFLIRRSTFETIGGFDPRFFLFFEDIDLCRRCWEAGARVVYLPSVTATDRKRRLSEGGVLRLLTRKSGRTHIASAIKYFWKWKGSNASPLAS